MLPILNINVADQSWICRLEKSCEPRCRLWGLDWKSTLEAAVRWPSSPPPPPSSPRKCEETGNLCNVSMTLNFVFLLHHLLLLLLPCRLTAALWARATKLVPTRHASKKQERGNADLEKWKDRDINRQNGGERGEGVISVTYLKFLWWAVYYL